MNYHNITKDDMNNGDGLRVVLWTAGCSHHCENCQNQITWDPDGGIEFDEDAKKELYSILDRDYISGITFSGGDPLYCGNRETIYSLIREIKELYPDKTIWVYTGYKFCEVLKFIPDDIIHNIDVLVDGRYVEALRDTKLFWRGSHNQRVIDVQKSLLLNKVIELNDK